MFMLFLSKGREPIGNPCQGTGVRTGKATLTLTAKGCLSRSPQAMGAVSCLTMLPLPAGPSARPLRGYNSHEKRKEAHLNGGEAKEPTPL